MKIELLRAYDEIPFPGREELHFIDELRCFPETHPAAGPLLSLPETDLLPETARLSLVRHFPVGPGGIPVEIIREPEFADEEFRLELRPEVIRISSAGRNGVRYGVYELEERLAAGRFGEVHFRPYITRRIARSCFSPNSRPPLCLDELTDDIDYYPDALLDRLAHERMNGVWITVYLTDMPNSFFPGQGKKAPQRLSKLRKVVDKCALYGIKCYLFMAEPRAFSWNWKGFTPDDLKSHPELGGHRDADAVGFCTSAPEGRAYLTETVEYLFSHVAGLGGIINIMCQESSYPCALWMLYPHARKCNCPLCSKRTAAELFTEIARTMSDAMKKHQPDAEFFGWFYAAFHQENEPENDLLLKVAEAWPADATFLYNCETGGQVSQLGKTHVVQDYSLSFPGPSDYWKKLAAAAPRIGAKMQTGCSHEDASIPYLPVPDILYERYAGLNRSACTAVLQCWYFGCFPGLMNRAAGRLSFLPFPESGEQFLDELARPEWGDDAPRVVAAWKLFGTAYRNFPESLPFKWFGPLHHSIVFPWHLFPVDLPMAPSYTQEFPKNSGDRIGECVGYSHTYAEIRELLARMEEDWQRGLACLKPCVRNGRQRRELELAEAIGLQIASSRRLFEFYHLREEMIFLHTDRKEDLRTLIEAEITATHRMAELCGHDSRIGYHAELESLIFFPEKLRIRELLLKELLADDLPHFDWNLPDIRRYSGESEEFFSAPEKEEKAVWHCLGNAEFKIFHDSAHLVFRFRRMPQELRLDVEPGRLSQIITVKLTPDGWNHASNFIPGMELRKTGSLTDVLFDLNFFRDFRASGRAPWRFNLSADSSALHELHPYPPRLCHGDVNPADLIFLKLM